MADSKPYILIVEDDPYILKMYELKLGMAGYDVKTAINGRLGLDKVREKKPDLILLDILMPEMDGFEVLEHLKGDPDTKGVPVLVLSNLGQEDHINKAMSFGVQGFIVKSQYTPSQVVETIKGVIKKK
ncbi:TPA: response regulator [candidate division CPR2 bacterium]|uniref:Two component transcriptional regulator, two-component system, OmpR family, phosphate regulon response regulator PhoB n=1 Tax=candidate division CPR2 bacterium GW2011_GWC1_41_48 TaxID=1618344 RepID=A0A0G0WC65_UNCC2|nr:MAG: Two component LuxR family transcriptional regulator [candidate division CPR2 bacterium GW2011_GWC2_39_35]KKR29482.1 MAG: Two component LuxR family transcriptional regulator [candidate division CPR2 bacterium GW2011_GWD2_39_7]KKR29707.1 MAG: Two component LuxR family transcriptional regulator [candidate division CPR2 bacterium GW2011_GWD1_39_7]KKS09637.1 MAG: two component transcriptional regulator, two-component system, OmpR family, phosphate regulon response regulator PhoB [candidate di